MQNDQNIPVLNAPVENEQVYPDENEFFDAVIADNN